MPITAGIDIGSVATKVVVLREGACAARAVARTGADPQHAAAEALAVALDEARLGRDDISRVISTGYGRRGCAEADGTLTEITAAARGVRAAGEAGVGTIIDVGGQDTKVIALDDAGRVLNFAMNDKCAAGTGKFLEVMAGALGVSLDNLAALALGAAQPARLSATCTVFAESEVITLIHRGVPHAEIAAGLHSAIAGQVHAMIKQVGLRGRVAFIGGGARNAAMRRALETVLGAPLLIPPHPQLVAATGAALTAQRTGRQR